MQPPPPPGSAANPNAAPGYNIDGLLERFASTYRRLDNLTGAPKKRKERVEQLLTRVGLADRMDHKPTELSGGQMQRVAIARALAMRPDVLLADEPTGNLDSSAGGDIMQLFTQLWEQGRTVVVITHDMSLARRASRIVEIHDGRIVSDTAAAA